MITERKQPLAIIGNRSLPFRNYDRLVLTTNVCLQALFEMGLAENSRDCFEFCVLPVVEKLGELIRNTKPSTAHNAAICLEIAKTILLRGSSFYMYLFTKSMESLEPDVLKELLVLSQKDSGLSSDSAIIDLFKFRTRWLTERINTVESVNKLSARVIGE